MFAVVAQLPVASRSGPGYWTLSRGPMASLALIAPLLLFYEGGVLWLGPQAIRNGADVWLRGLLDLLGFGHYFLLPSLTVAALLVWHHLSGAPWRLPPRVCGGMILESTLLAVCLLGLAQVQGRLLPMIGVAPSSVRDHEIAGAGPRGASEGEEKLLPTASVSSHREPAMSRLVAFLGAGIYEEALFRLMLLPAAMAVLERLGLARAASVLWSVALTSVLFALAHYLGPHGDAWQAYSFVFRTLAGAFFALLFVYRGFGVTAGAHAGYDILVGLC